MWLMSLCVLFFEVPESEAKKKNALMHKMYLYWLLIMPKDLLIVKDLGATVVTGSAFPPTGFRPSLAGPAWSPPLGHGTVSDGSPPTRFFSTFCRSELAKPASKQRWPNHVQHHDALGIVVSFKCRELHGMVVCFPFQKAAQQSEREATWNNMFDTITRNLESEPTTFCSIQRTGHSLHVTCPA